MIFLTLRLILSTTSAVSMGSNLLSTMETLILAGYAGPLSESFPATTFGV